MKVKCIDNVKNKLNGKGTYEINVNGNIKM